MAIFYLDTSALVKRYRTERGSEVVAQLLTNPPPQDRFYVSFLSIPELTSGIMRLVKGEQIYEALATEIIARFRQDIRDTLLVWRLNENIISSAIP